MKATFITSLRSASNDDSDWNREIIKLLNSRFSKVYADHILNYNQSSLDQMSEEEKISFHQQIIRNIQKSDFVVGEVTNSSLGVGFLLAFAQSKQKPIILLYRSKQSPTNLLSTLEKDTSRFLSLHYSSRDELGKLLSDAIEFIGQNTDTRFTMLFSTEIVQHLDRVAETKNVSRSEYIRRLIRKEMKKNKL